MNRDEKLVAKLVLLAFIVLAFGIFITEYELPSDNKETLRVGVVHKCSFEQIAKTGWGRYVFHFELLEHNDFELRLHVDVSQIQELRSLCEVGALLRVKFRVVKTLWNRDDRYIVERIDVIKDP